MSSILTSKQKNHKLWLRFLFGTLNEFNSKGKRSCKTINGKKWINRIMNKKKCQRNSGTSIWTLSVESNRYCLLFKLMYFPFAWRLTTNEKNQNESRLRFLCSFMEIHSTHFGSYFRTTFTYIFRYYYFVTVSHWKICFNFCRPLTMRWNVWQQK